jgi:putative hydrolase of the HAD superfamily
VSPRRPYILLDAGGTLVIPHVEHIDTACRTLGRELATGAFFGAFFRRIHALDETLRSGGTLASGRDLVMQAIADAGAGTDVARNAFEAARAVCAPASLWTYALPGVGNALARLREAGFSIAVVSNSDGTVRRQLVDLGLSTFLDATYDSHELGIEKPDPAIFHAVLADRGLDPGACLYVGDVFGVDVRGANAAGIAAIHLDPLGIYGDWPGLHVLDLQAVADVLIEGWLALDDPRLMPVG